MVSPTKLFLILLFTIATITSASVISPNSMRKISPEIINELKDFLDLIPTATVDEIVAKHYIIDSNFREVLKYVRSNQFTALLQQAQQIPEIVEILDYLHVLLPDTAASTERLRTSYATMHARSYAVELELFEPQLNFVLLNELENEVMQLAATQLNHIGYTTTTTTAPTPTPTIHHLRTFSSFMEELMGHLPHDQYVQMINQKRQHNLTFAQFYAALRSAELRPMVDTSLKSSNLTTIIKTLRSNGVDVQSLEGIAFKVISWGPAPISPP